MTNMLSSCLETVLLLKYYEKLSLAIKLGGRAFRKRPPSGPCAASFRTSTISETITLATKISHLRGLSCSTRHNGPGLATTGGEFHATQTRAA
jgi:hypothetical protein